MLAKSKRLSVLVLVSVILLAGLNGCSTGGLLSPKTDIETYETLVKAKTDVLLAYDTFISDTPDTAKVQTILSDLEKARLLEAKRGKRNQPICDQIETLITKTKRNYNSRVNEGIWSQEHLDNIKIFTAEAFDTVIETVRSTTGR
jgi:hypothetical protein